MRQPLTTALLVLLLLHRFVQCYSCGNPETVIKIRKRSETIELKCKACGFVR